MALERITNLRPVKRYRSERYVLISLATFALSVVVLRGVLKLTGYPSIGNDTVHIAHVLWGGLALFASSLLLLIVSNRWALSFGAVLSGGGVALFIDEVGKFITQSNNYFTPSAAPIIYGLFLGTVLIYLQLRRPRSRDTRGEMYKALEQLPQIVDREMSRHDLNVLRRRLEKLHVSAEDQALRDLAAAMLVYVRAEEPRIVEQRPGRIHSAVVRVRALGRRTFSRSRLRVFLIVALIGLGVYAVIDMAILAFLAFAPASGAADFLRPHIAIGELQALRDEIWFSIRAVLEGGVGVALLTSGVLMTLRRECKSVQVAVVSLIVDLTVVDLLVFYQDTIKALVGIAVQYILLAATLAYRRIYLEDEAEEAGRADAHAENAFAAALYQAAADTYPGRSAP